MANVNSVNNKDIEDPLEIEKKIEQEESKNKNYSGGFRFSADNYSVGYSLPTIWQYRELIYFLVWRDLKIRYKQTIIGAAWAIIQPFFTMVIYTVIFGQIAQISTDGIPYPIFSYSALLPWTFFSVGLAQASDSLVSSGHIIRKIYFPRLILPLARILGCLLDFLLASVVLLIMMMFYNVHPSLISILVLPIMIFSLILVTLSISLWFSALNVRYRDVRYVVPFFIQIWMFLTPIIYSSSEVSHSWQVIYNLNPLTSIVEGFRYALIGSENFSWSMFAISSAVTLLVLITGTLYFQRAEITFADTI